MDLNSQTQTDFRVGQLVRPFAGLLRGELGVVDQVDPAFDRARPYLVRIGGGRNRYAAEELLRVWVS